MANTCRAVRWSPANISCLCTTVSIPCIFIAVTFAFFSFSACQSSNDEQAAPNAALSLGDAGRAPFLVFDSAAFLQERMEAIEAARPFLDTVRRYETFVEQAQDWVFKGQAEDNWRALQARIGIERVLFTWDDGSENVSSHLLSAVIVSNGQILAVTRARWRDEPVTVDTLSFEEWAQFEASTVSACFSFDESRLLFDGADLPIIILTLYTTDPPMTIVTNSTVFYENGSAEQAYFHHLRRMFGMQPVFSPQD